MTTLTTLTVRVLNARGKDMFMNPRFLRVVNDGKTPPTFAVARHGKALIVTGIASHDSVTVDSTAARVDLANTRAAKLADIGLTPKAKPAAEKATTGELPVLVEKYKKAIQKAGPTWIENALRFTKDPVKVQAMEIALGRRKPEAPAAAAKPKSPKPLKPRETKVDVTALAKALSEGGADAGMAYLKGLVTDGE